MMVFCLQVWDFDEDDSFSSMESWQHRKIDVEQQELLKYMSIDIRNDPPCTKI